MSKWQRFLLLEADGVVNNINNYSHSMREWINKVFDKFMDEPIESFNLKETMEFNIKYRKLRKEQVPTKGIGQGKGIEKGKKMKVNEDKTFTLPQQPFIKELGNEVGFKYISKQWDCFENMKLVEFVSATIENGMVKRSDRRNKEKLLAGGAVSNFNRLIKDNDLVSLIFSNSAGKIDYTIIGDTNFF